MSKIKVQWIEDPGHAWLAVAANDFFDTHADLLKVSDYSYYGKPNGTPTFYLEEDCDAPYFMAICEAAGVKLSEKPTKVYGHSEARERDYPSISVVKEALKKCEEEVLCTQAI